jgi:hypothetical protein
LGLFDTINPVYDPEDEVFRRRLQQKKKRKQVPRLEFEPKKIVSQGLWNLTILIFSL